MADSHGKNPSIRRIVTGHDAKGKAIVWLDGPAGNHKFPDEKVSSTLMWSTDASPADFSIDDDAGARMLGTAPPAGGTRFAVLEIQPGNTLHGLHRTDTVDYVICISGQIDMELGDSKVTMKAGDIMVQRGTFHGWVNRSNEPARIAVVLIDGKPKRDDSIVGNLTAR